MPSITVFASCLALGPNTFNRKKDGFYHQHKRLTTSRPHANLSRSLLPSLHPSLSIYLHLLLSFLLSCSPPALPIFLPSPLPSVLPLSGPLLSQVSHVLEGPGQVVAMTQESQLPENVRDNGNGSDHAYSVPPQWNLEGQGFGGTLHAEVAVDDELKGAQREAHFAESQAVRVVARPGSGKARVLAQWIAHVVRKTEGCCQRNTSQIRGLPSEYKCGSDVADSTPDPTTATNI